MNEHPLSWSRADVWSERDAHLESVQRVAGWLLAILLVAGSLASVTIGYVYPMAALFGRAATFVGDTARTVALPSIDDVGR